MEHITKANLGQSAQWGRFASNQPTSHTSTITTTLVLESLRSQFYEAKCDYFRMRIVYTKIIQIHAWDCNGAISNISECEISSSHSGEYEAQNLLGCTAVFLIECRPTFQRYALPPSPEWSHRPDDSGSTDLWNVGRHSIKNTVVYPIRFWASYSPSWEHEISHS
jgi:hypothetical protein